MPLNHACPEIPAVIRPKWEASQQPGLKATCTAAQRGSGGEQPRGRGPSRATRRTSCRSLCWGPCASARPASCPFLCAVCITRLTLDSSASHHSVKTADRPAPEGVLLQMRLMYACSTCACRLISVQHLTWMSTHPRFIPSDIRHAQRGTVAIVRTFAAAVYSSSSQRFGLEVPGLGTVGSEATVTISNLMPLQYQALTMQVHSFFVRCGVRQAVNGVWRIASSGMTAMKRPLGDSRDFESL